MEGQRRYADEPEPSWYSGQDQYSSPTSNAYDPGVHEQPSGVFRLPEQRDSEDTGSSPYATSGPVTSTGGHEPVGEQSRDQVRIPVRGPEYPTIHSDNVTSLADAPPTMYGGGSSAPVSAPGTFGGGASTPPMTYGGSSVPPATYGSDSSTPPTIYGDSSAAPPTYGSDTSTPPTVFGDGSSAAAGAYGGGSSAPVSSSPSEGAGTAYNEPTGVVPPISRLAADGRPADSVYRTRRPLSAVVIAVVTILLMVPTVLLLIHATFVADPVARGIVPAVLLTLGLPLTGAGLFGLAGGGMAGRDALLRPPVVYLPVGLILVVTAGLAAA